MYRVSKEFKFSMGHRLSCHDGACKNIHGHNYAVIVGVKSAELNDNGMVIDFSNLKATVSGFLEIMDHALMVNDTDRSLVKKMKEHFPSMKIIETAFEPTAENMAREIFENVGKVIKKMWKVDVDYVTVYETDSSQATYSLE